MGVDQRMTYDPSAHEATFRRDPANSDAFAALRRAYLASQRTDALALLYERHATALGDPRRAAEILWQAAEVHRQRQDARSERRTLQKAAALDATHRGALDRLIELAESEERWSELVGLLELSLTLLGQRNEKRNLARQHHRVGRLWEDRFGRLDRAIEHYQAAFKNEPDHAEAIEAGRRIYATVGRWSTVAQLYDVELSTVHEARRKVELLLALADLRRDKLQDLEAAARALSEASQLRPGDEPIMEALGEIYASPEWPNPGGLERAAQIFIQIAQRRESKSDRDGAIAYLRRALGADPENEAAATRLERAYRETGRWEDLDRLFRQRISVATPNDARELQLRRGELLERKLGDLRGARECYEGILEDEPFGGPAEARLRDLYRAGEEWKKLLELHRRALGLTNAPDARARLLMEMAELQREHLDAPEAAALLLHEVLQIDPQHRRALAAYENYFRDKGDFRNLAELLRFSVQSAQEEGAPPMELCSRLEELADISENRLGDLPGAYEAWQQIAKLHHDVRRSRDTLARLQAKIEHFQDIARRLKYEVTQAVSPGERRAALRKMAQVFFDKNIDPLQTIEILREVVAEDPHDELSLDMLAQLYQREADPEGQAWALRQRLEGILTRPERLDTLQRLGKLYRGPLDRSSDARWAYRELTQVLPQDSEVQEQLQRLLEQAEDYQGLAEHLDRRSQVAGSVDERQATLRALAQLMDGELEAPARAAEAWERVLGLDEDDEEALEALTRLYERLGRSAERSTILQRRLTRSAGVSPVSRARLLRDLAHIVEQDVSRADQAVHAYEELAELLPADRDALVALERLYTQLERYSELVQVLERQIELAEESEERAGLAFKLVDVLEEKLGDVDAAAQAYERIISEIAPGDLEGYRRLRQLHRRRGDHRRACEVAQLELFLLPAETPPQERAELALEIAELWWDKLQEAERATAAYELVLELVPGHADALLALRRLYHRIGGHQRLVALAPQLFGTLSEDRERQILLFEIAQVWEQQLGDAQQAFDWYRRAHDLYPHDGTALEQLRRMAAEHDLWEELFTVFGEARKRARDANAVIALSREMMAVSRDRLQDPAKAFSVLAEGLRVDPAGHELLLELEHLANAMGLHEPLYGVYGQLLPACDAPRRHDLLRRRAKLAEDLLAAPGPALEDTVRLYQEIHGAELPMAVPLLDEIERLAEAAQRWPRALDVHFARLQACQTNEQRLSILAHLAALLEGPLGSAGRAFDARLHALLLQPEDGSLLAEAWRLAESLSAKPTPLGPSDTLLGDDDAEEAIEELDATELVDLSQPRAFPPPVAPPPPPRASGPASLPPLVIAPAGAERGDEQTLELDGDAVELLEEPLEPPPSPGQRPSPPPRPPQPPRQHAAPRRATSIGSVLLEPPREGSPWQRLAETLRQAAAGLERRHRAQRLLVVARVWSEGARDTERAFASLTEAAALDLEDPTAREALEALAVPQGNWPRLFAAYSDLIEQASQSATLVQLHLRAGALQLEHGSRDAAERHFEAVLAIDPTHHTASDALRAIYEGRAAYEPLAAMLERQLEALRDQLDEEGHASRLRELANLHEEQLDHPYEAAGFLARLLELRPTAMLLTRLANLYERVTLWPQHVDTLERLLDATDDPVERAAVQQRRARVLEEELELPHRAIEAYRQALDEDPNAAAALTALERLYGIHGQDDELIAVLRRRMDGVVEPTELRRIAVRLSRALEQQGRLDEAAAALTAAREGGLVDPDIDERLAQVLVASGRTTEAVDLLRERAERSRAAGRPAQEVVALLVRLARLQDETLEDPEAARGALDQALELDPGNIEALEELAAHELRADQLDAHADVVLRICERLAAGEAVVQRLLACATLLRERGAEERAVDLYERVLRQDRRQLPAINALLALVTDKERRLLLLTRKLDLTNDARRQARLLIEIGGLQRLLGRPSNEAAATFQRALELAPDHVPAIDALSQLLIDEGQSAPARLLLERSIEQLANTPEARQAGQLYYRLAQLFEREQRDEEGYRYLMEAVRLRSKDLLVRLAVGQNRFRAARWREASRHLSEALDHPEAADHAAEAAEALYCAGVCEQRLRRGERALPFFQAALALAPTHALALEELATAALDSGDVKGAADFLGKLATVTEEPPRRVALWAAVADLYLDQLGDEARAASCFETVCRDLAEGHEDLDATRLEVLPRAIPLVRRYGDPAVAGAAARTLASQLDDAARSAQLLVAAEAFAAAKDWVNADACRREVLTLDPVCTEAALGLAQSLEAQGRPTELIDLLHEHLKQLPRLAAPDERPMRAAVHAILARVHRGLGQVDETIDALEAQLDLQEDEGVRLHLAELFRDQPRRATAALANHRVLARNIENTESLRALAVASQRSEPDRAYCLHRVLTTLGVTDEAGEDFLRSFQPRALAPADKYGGELTDADREALLTPPSSTDLREVLAVLWEGASLLLPRHIEDFGVGSDDRVSPVEKTNLALVFSACARALGLKATSLYHAPASEADGAPGDEIIVAALARPALIVPRGLGERLPLARLRFVIGRALELTQPTAIFAAGLERKEFARILTTVLRAFHPRHLRRRAALGPDDETRKQSEELRRAFPYKPARRLGELFRERPNMRFDSAAWRRAVHISANRAGLVLSGDLDSAVQQLVSEDPGLEGLPLFPDALRKSTLLRDLVTFATSDAYYACRLKLGLVG